MSLPSKKETIYGNCCVLHPDGFLMFRCSQDRIDWYLERELAKLVQVDPPTIQLKFMPQGHGNNGDEFYLAQKENRCVVCGSKEDLTRHHVVPFCYRRFFPEKYKSRHSHDVLPACISCHEIYEKEAFEFKKELAANYGLVLNSYKIDVIYNHAKSAANALVKYKERIPQERQEFLIKRISRYLEQEATEDDVLQLAALPSRSQLSRGQHRHGKLLVEKIEDIDEFVIMWRKHFVDIMQPRYLLKGWDVYRRY